MGGSESIMLARAIADMKECNNKTFSATSGPTLRSSTSQKWIREKFEKDKGHASKHEETPPGAVATKKGSAAKTRGIIPDKANLEIIKTVMIHPRPRIYQHYDFITSEECRKVINLGLDNLKRATIGIADKHAKVSTARTSQAGSLPTKALLIQNILLRACAMHDVSPQCCEVPQLIQYRVGQLYRPHLDFNSNPARSNQDPLFENSGQRVISMVVYLNEDFEGGKTNFTELEGVSVTPVKGSVASWWNKNQEGEMDTNTRHESMKITRGVKYAMSIFIREKPLTDPMHCAFY